ncbi:hypothetical protein BBJ28_00004187 [Nothophytophthora sp. Chile5]|nr:hypothetical protein BBJ28_00004187 [Nothophytophthora sp. Chile5]
MADQPSKGNTKTRKKVNTVTKAGVTTKHAASPSRAPHSRADAGTGHTEQPPRQHLNNLQIAELLKPFWMELLQNNVKSVKKILHENRFKMDFNTARHTASAGGTGLHVCAQHGYITCAKLLLEAGIGIDLQNKVGSTSLHVACKFNQKEMVTFLLESGARIDVPDIRGKLAEARREEAQLLEVQRTIWRQFEETKTEKMHASMILADYESQAWEERQTLQITSDLDREWSERVHKSKELLESKKATFKELQRLLQMEQDQMVETWKNVFHAAQDHKQRAGEHLEQMLMLVQETDQQLAREQQDLNDQCGLLDAALEFPNDVEVQLWVLSSMLAMLDEAEDAHQPGKADIASISNGSIDGMLLREEVATVVRNVLQRFPTTRELQCTALQCLLRLVRRCIRILDTPQELELGVVSTENHPRASNFLAALIKDNVMALSRDALVRFDQDVQLAHVVFELLYHLLQCRGIDGTHGLLFSQSRHSHHLPLQLFRLHEAILQSQDDSNEPSELSYSQLDPTAVLSARLHASFLLFTLAKYNVRKTLEKDGAVLIARRLIFELAKDPTSESDVKNESKATALQYLLGSLALLYSPPSSRSSRHKSSPWQEQPPVWSVEHVRQLLEALRPWISRSRLANNCRVTRQRDNLSYWTLKFVRNLTWTDTHEVVELRAELRRRETFHLFADITLAVRQCCSAGGEGDTVTQNMVVVWLELVEDMWLGSYDSDGQLGATPTFVLEFLLQLLEFEAQLIASQNGEPTLAELTAVLKIVALVLSNGKNSAGYRLLCY